MEVSHCASEGLQQLGRGFSPIERACRWSLYAIAALAGLRAALYLFYTGYRIPFPLETHLLEAKMVHLAWRVQAGQTLYPEWEEYPHVTNFFAPLYFWCLGGLGTALDASLDELFLIGRLMTLAFTLLTTVAVAIFLRRRYGAAAALIGGVATLGASPMYAFAVMVRPDVMADSLGLTGFLLVLQRTRKSVLLGGALLAAACLTKQTAGLYLLASLAAFWIDPSARRFGWLLAGWTAGLLGAAVLVLQYYEPGALRSLFGEAGSPMAVQYWAFNFHRLVTSSPELPLLAVAGTAAWTWFRPREIDLAVLASMVLVVSMATSAKLGADLNYYLALRGVEALALGKLWHSSAALSGYQRGAAATILLLAALLMIPSVQYAAAQCLEARQRAEYLESASGRETLARFNRVLQLAERPGVHLLTDSGMLALRQRDRAPFVDPWLFRMLVQTGRIHPAIIEERLRRQDYDLLVLTSDLYASHLPYELYAFGLPEPLIRAARGGYEPAGYEGGLFIYRPVRARRPP